MEGYGYVPHGLNERLRKERKKYGAGKPILLDVDLVRKFARKYYFKERRRGL